MDSFKKLGLKKEILDVIEEMHFKEPSEIQEKSIPFVLQGEDVIGNAATGSGKTFAFGSGLVQNLSPKKGVQGLVLTPTRELAEQITKVMKIFAKKTGLRIQEVYGGVSFDRQVEGIERSEIIIGTPGRILDHLKQRTLDLSKVSILVLDEADRMVDMGFLPDVEQIMQRCPEKKQTLLFSATMSPDIEYIEKKYMKDTKHVSVKKYVDPGKLKQYYYDVPTNLKFSLLVQLLKQERSGIIMIFCNTRSMVDLIDQNLKDNKINSHAIHGGLTQGRRGKVIDSMHNNEVDILICTDVAARGLDIKGVSHVYNFDCPKTPEEYIHRIGRTARAGEDGLAITLISNKDYDNFRRVLEDHSLKLEQKELPNIDQIFFRTRMNDRRDRGRSRFGRGERRTSVDREFRPRGRFNNRSGGRDNRGPRRDNGRNEGRRPRRDDRNSRRDNRRSDSPRRSFQKRY